MLFCRSAVDSYGPEARAATAAAAVVAAADAAEDVAVVVVAVILGSVGILAFRIIADPLPS